MTEQAVTEQGVPRRSVEPDSTRQLAAKLAAVERAVAALGKTANLRNASITDDTGVTRLRFSAEDAAIIAYDTAGAEVARYGLLSHSDPGEYGIEALAGGTWVHIGNESMTWDNVAGKPATFPPTLPIAAANVSGSIAEAVHAAQADGSQYGFENTVAGTTFYALWVGNDGGYHFGRNVSSIRYKENVRALVDGALPELPVPVVYDRKPTDRPALTADGLPAEGPAYRSPGAKNEFGLIAENVYEVWPETVTWFDHGDGAGPVIDGIRYDLTGVRLIPYVQELRDAVARLTADGAARDKLIQELIEKVNALGG